MRIISKYITEDFVEFYNQKNAIDYEQNIYKPVKTIFDKLGDQPETHKLEEDEFKHVVHDINTVDQVKWDLVNFLLSKQMNRVNAINLVFKKDHKFLNEPVINQSHIIINLLGRLFRIDDKCREWNCDLHLVEKPMYEAFKQY